MGAVPCGRWIDVGGDARDARRLPRRPARARRGPRAQREHLGRVQRGVGARDGRVHRACSITTTSSRRKRLPKSSAISTRTRTRTSSTRTRTSSTSRAGARDPYFKPDWSPDLFLILHVRVPSHGGSPSTGRRGRRIPSGVRRRAGLRSSAAPDGEDGPDSPHPAHPLSLAQRPDVDGAPGGVEAVGARGRPPRAGGSRRRNRPRRRSPPGLDPGHVSRPARDSRRSAGIDRDSDDRMAASRRRATCWRGPAEPPDDDVENFEVVLAVDSGTERRGARRALARLPHQIVDCEPRAAVQFPAQDQPGGAPQPRRARRASQRRHRSDRARLARRRCWSIRSGPRSAPSARKLFYPDGRLQHVGMLVGVCGLVAHAFHRHPGRSPGYSGNAVVIRNCSAVTAACCMTRRAVFDEVGGLDEALPVDFNDVDFCLRVRRAGYRIVFTPYAQLYHHESASFGRRMQSARELALMRQRWGRTVEQDPYYNPNLSKNFSDYRLQAVTPSLVPCAICGQHRHPHALHKFGHDIGRCDRCGLVYANPRGPAEVDPRALRRRVFLERVPAGTRRRRRTSTIWPGSMRATLRCCSCSARRRAGACSRSDAARDFLSKQPSGRAGASCGIELSDDGSRFARDRLGLDVRRERAEAMTDPNARRSTRRSCSTRSSIYSIPAQCCARFRARSFPADCLVVSTPNFNALSRHLLGKPWAVLSPLEHMYYFEERTLAASARGVRFHKRAVRARDTRRGTRRKR